MTALAEREQTVQLVNALPDSQIHLVLAFVQGISGQTSAARPQAEKQKALEELFSLWQPADHEISRNGTKEIARIMLDRYEKSFS